MNGNPIAAAFAATPFWMLTIREFDAIEVHPCCTVGFANSTELAEICEPEAAQFWAVYGRYETGGSEPLEEFPTEVEARGFADRVRRIYPHLAASSAAAA
jgi:hypothetical protein